MHRFYAPALRENDETASLDEDDASHLVRVLRLVPGSEVRIFNGGGLERVARVELADKRGVVLRVIGSVDPAPELPFPFEIKILGADLQLGGITQNQSIRDFEARDKTLAEILTAMVMKANPITTVKAPSEPDQKLIWVVGPDPSDASRNIILITTRDAAAKKNYTLPDVFK